MLLSESKIATTVAAVFAILILAVAVAALTVLSPRTAGTATGVATESYREVNETKVTPVRYSYAGVERTAMVPYVTAMAGETVTFPVTSTGNPEWGSWFGATFLAAIILLLGGMLVPPVWLVVDTIVLDRPTRPSRRKPKDLYYML